VAQVEAEQTAAEEDASRAAQADAARRTAEEEKELEAATPALVPDSREVAEEPETAPQEPEERAAAAELPIYRWFGAR
jgi:hypothetical protein